MESVLSCSKTENYLAAWNRLNQWDFIKLYCYLPNFFKYRCSEHSSIGLERTKTEPYSEYVDSNVIGLKRKKPNLTVNTLILTSYLTFYRFIQKLGKKKKTEPCNKLGKNPLTIINSFLLLLVVCRLSFKNKVAYRNSAKSIICVVGNLGGLKTTKSSAIS